MLTAIPGYANILKCDYLSLSGYTYQGRLGMANNTGNIRK